MAPPIRSIAVVGDGIAAWAAAAAFARRLGVKVAVVHAPDAAPSLSDRFGAMQLSARAFHDAIGIGETDLFARADGVVRLGMAFDGWSGIGSDYLQPFGTVGVAIGGAPFHQLWARAARDGDRTPFAAYSPTAALADAGRFLPSDGDDWSPLAKMDYALTVDAERYRAMLRGYALHLGVSEAPPLGSVDREGDRIAGLDTANGRILADLYVDASGPQAMLFSGLPGGDDGESWAGWLPCDRVAIATVSAARDITLSDRASAEANGWRLESPGRLRTTRARIYAAKGLRDDAAAGAVGGDATFFALAQGRRRAAWIGNCVAIGDAAVEIEPLEAPHLRLIHAAIERIISLLPDSGFAAIEIERFNREWAEEVDHLRDMLILHYHLARRAEPFWKTERPPLPESLARMLALFAERGRLPHRDFESFSPDSWRAVLFGQGMIPRRTDPLADTVTPAEFARRAAHFRQDLVRVARAAPAHRDWLDRPAAGHAA